MRILYIGTPYSVHDVKWATFFSALKDYEVFFVCQKQDIPPGKQDADVREYYRQLNITYLGSLDSFSVSHPVTTVSSISKLKKLLRDNKIDLVHILFAAPFALWGLFVPCKYIITTRGSDILMVIPALKKQGGIKGIYFGALFNLFKKSFRGAAKITGTSARQVQKAKELMLDGASHPQLQVIRTGVDVQAISTISNNEWISQLIKGKKFIFSPRYMKPIYNIGLQLDAINKLNADVLKNYCFVFIRGESYDKAYYNEITTRLEQLRTEKGIQYFVIDKMTQPEIGQYYKYAALTIMTPLSDGTPNTALEAMAAKCPLIVPNLPYDKELFKDTCIQLNSYDANELADKITTALTNYPPQMIDKAFEAVNKFGNRNTEMLKLQNIYLEANKSKQ